MCSRMRSTARRRRKHARPAVILAQRRECGRDGRRFRPRRTRALTSQKTLNQPPACLNANSSRSLTPKNGPRSTPTSDTLSCGSLSARSNSASALTSARLGEGAGAADLHRDLQCLERLDVRKEPVLPLAREDEEIAVLRRPASTSDRMNLAMRSASAVATSSLSTSSAIVKVQTPEACATVLHFFGSAS